MKAIHMKQREKAEKAAKRAAELIRAAMDSLEKARDSFGASECPGLATECDEAYITLRSTIIDHPTIL